MRRTAFGDAYAQNSAELISVLIEEHGLGVEEVLATRPERQVAVRRWNREFPWVSEILTKEDPHWVLCYVEGETASDVSSVLNEAEVRMKEELVCLKT